MTKGVDGWQGGCIRGKVQRERKGPKSGNAKGGASPSGSVLKLGLQSQKERGSQGLETSTSQRRSPGDC